MMENFTKADEYIGKHLLVGLTYLNHSGELIEHIQRHGIIKAITASGVEIELKGIHAGQSFNLPPDLEMISPAKIGIYDLKSTGEKIENPDFLATWNIHKKD